MCEMLRYKENTVTLFKDEDGNTSIRFEKTGYTVLWPYGAEILISNGWVKVMDGDPIINKIKTMEQRWNNRKCPR